MKYSRQLLILLLAPVFVFVASAPAKTIRVDAPSTQMTAREARKALTASLGKLSWLRSIDNIRYTKEGLRFVAVYDFGPGSKNTGKPIPSRITFADFEKVTLVSQSLGQWWHVNANRKAYLLDDNKAMSLMFDTQQAAKEFADAALILKSAALSPETEEADFSAFSVKAKAWLATTPKPEMSDEARTFKLLAEDAFKRKDFPAALDAYAEALVRHPLWPEGHYNAALLAAETEDYESAAHHMRRYLVLAPDAKDAGSAKDKLLVWQIKAKN